MPAASFFARSQINRGRCGVDSRSGQNDSDCATPHIAAIVDFDSSSMRFRDLAGKHQPDSASVRFGRVEGSKDVGRIHQTRARDRRSSSQCRRHSCSSELQPPRRLRESIGFRGTALRFENSVRGVAHEIDKHLLQLVGVGLKRYVRSGCYAHLDSGLESCHARNQRIQCTSRKTGAGICASRR